MTRSPVLQPLLSNGDTQHDRALPELRNVGDSGEKSGRSVGADRPRVVPGLPGSSRTAVQPQGYTGLAIVPFTIGVNAVRLSCMVALPRP